MNERLHQLMRQAQSEAYANACVKNKTQRPQNNTVWNEFPEVFAELIVRECGQVLVDNTPVVDLVEDWDKGYDRAMNDSIHHIYEHFGLEE